MTATGGKVAKSCAERATAYLFGKISGKTKANIV